MFLLQFKETGVGALPLQMSVPCAFKLKAVVVELTERVASVGVEQGLPRLRTALQKVAASYPSAEDVCGDCISWCISVGDSTNLHQHQSVLQFITSAVPLVVVPFCMVVSHAAFGNVWLGR